jgi:hypothetical protein
MQKNEKRTRELNHSPPLKVLSEPETQQLKR